ncbi:hypothetical protein BD414DRAFT_119640 [Trametes punicea]|nr:hypothetical protein BD414DRAFT_119640 [Trametes punicea]
MSILVTAPPKTPCVRCSQSHDTPAAFLMACFKCKRAWHHRCHIPPVTEKEIIDRINADEQGKHDAGLAAWQCRVCSKKRRVEDISADGTASRDNTSKIARSQAADGTNLHELKASASNPTDTTPPVVPAKSASNALPSNVVVIDIDDDVDIVEVVPRPGAMNQTQVAQPVMPTEKKPPEVNRHVDNSSLESSVAAGRPPPKPTFRDHVRHKGNGGRVIPSQIAQSQGRSARDTFVITPLAPPGHSRKQASSQSSRGGNSTSVHAAETGSVSEPSPSAPRPRKETSTVSTKDIRELISSLRAKAHDNPHPAQRPPVTTVTLSSVRRRATSTR